VNEPTAAACAMCEGIDRARLEPAQAARLSSVRCSRCHRRIGIERVTASGRPIASDRFTGEAA
jgi:hypothetical protein